MLNNESVEFDVIDADGNPATVGIEKVSSNIAVGTNRSSSSTTEWKIWYVGVTINAEFYMTVSNNNVTSVYDYRIITVGGTYSEASLTRTSTYGKLTFNYSGLNGIIGATCWLKAAVTGSNNDVTTSWAM